MLTYYISEPCLIFEMLNHHILHAINSIFFLQKHKRDTMILTSRILNNLLVNDVFVSGRIMQEVVMSKLVRFCGEIRGQDEVRLEIAEVFMNLLHFMNDDG